MALNPLYFFVRLNPSYRRVLKAYARMQRQTTGKQYHESDSVRAGIDLLKEKMALIKKSARFKIKIKNS